MNRFDQLSSWVIVAVFALVAAGGLGFWWLRATVTGPSCGEVAQAQLDNAVEELQGRIPGLRFDGVGDSCNSGGEVYAFWEHDDLGQLLSDAAAAGCRVDEPDPADEDASESLTCKTAGRDVVLIFEVGTVPISGDLFLSDAG